MFARDADIHSPTKQNKQNKVFFFIFFKLLSCYIDIFRALIIDIIGFKIYYFKSFIAGGYTLLGRCGLV